MQESVINTTFSIARASTIPSDNTQHKVNVAVIELTPEFEHETVPGKTPHVFLKAKVKNTSSYPLLPGGASVFLDNNFIAKVCFASADVVITLTQSGLKAVSPEEEFTCSLGVDPSVRIDYKPAKKHYDESGLINRYTSVVHSQDIVIKNTKAKDAVKLRLLEQIPLSTEEKMRVQVVKPDLRERDKTAPFRLNKENILEWDLELAPGKEEHLEIKWIMEHPRGETIDYRED